MKTTITDDTPKFRKCNPLYWIYKFEQLPDDSIVTLIFLTSMFLAIGALCIIILAHKI